jgi:hypothetical protein
MEHHLSPCVCCSSCHSHHHHYHLNPFFLPPPKTQFQQPFPSVGKADFLKPVFSTPTCLQHENFTSSKHNPRAQSSSQQNPKHKNTKNHELETSLTHSLIHLLYILSSTNLSSRISKDKDNRNNQKNQKKGYTTNMQLQEWVCAGSSDSNLFLQKTKIQNRIPTKQIHHWRFPSTWSDDWEYGWSSPTLPTYLPTYLPCLPTYPNYLPTLIPTCLPYLHLQHTTPWILSKFSAPLFSLVGWDTIPSGINWFHQDYSRA